MSEKQVSHDLAEIRRLIEEWREALMARDPDRLTRAYAPEVVFFDVVPPFARHGAEAYRRGWEALFPYLPAQVAVEMREVQITLAEEMALMHGQTRLVDAATGADATCGWVRVTVVYRKVDETWRVVHEHASVPSEPPASQAVFDWQ